MKKKVVKIIKESVVAYLVVLDCTHTKLIYSSSGDLVGTEQYCFFCKKDDPSKFTQLNIWK